MKITVKRSGENSARCQRSRAILTQLSEDRTKRETLAGNNFNRRVLLLSLNSILYLLIIYINSNFYDFINILTMKTDLCSISHIIFYHMMSYYVSNIQVPHPLEIKYFSKCDPPTTVGSKSTKTALGTCLPAPVSLKNVLKESSPPPMVLSLGI